MKIGIVTFFRVTNYGAMLQSCALHHVLQTMGHEVIFVAHSRIIARRIPLWRCFVSRNFKGVIDKLKKYVRFPMTEFAATFPQTGICRTMAEVREATLDCDAFIVGSDQMWNPVWSSGTLLPLMMLDFADESKPRIAYAASFGTNEWREDQNARIAGELLRKFRRISVREASGVALANGLSRRDDAVHVLDPTLLHAADFYRAIIAANRVRVARHSKPMVFRYMLDEWDDAKTSQKAFDFVKEKLGLEEVETDRVPVRGMLGVLCRALSVTAKVSVTEWLAKIAAADFVFTNSFHGTVFSVLFRRPFVSVLLRGSASGMNERALSLLKKLGLESRAVYADDISALEKAITSSVDWDQVDIRLDELRREAYDFLRGALEKD